MKEVTLSMVEGNSCDEGKSVFINLFGTKAKVNRKNLRLAVKEYAKVMHKFFITNAKSRGFNIKNLPLVHIGIVFLVPSIWMPRPQKELESYILNYLKNKQEK